MIKKAKSVFVIALMGLTTAWTSVAYARTDDIVLPASPIRQPPTQQEIKDEKFWAIVGKCQPWAMENSGGNVDKYEKLQGECHTLNHLNNYR